MVTAKLSMLIQNLLEVYNMPDAEKKMLTEKEYQYAKQRSYCYINNSKLRVGLRLSLIHI